MTDPKGDHATDNSLDFNYQTRCLRRQPADKYQARCQQRLENACLNNNHNTTPKNRGLSVRELRNALLDQLQDDPSVTSDEIYQMRRCQLNRLCRKKILKLPTTTPKPPLTIVNDAEVLPPISLPDRDVSQPPEPTRPIPTTPTSKRHVDFDSLQLPVVFRCTQLDSVKLYQILCQGPGRPGKVTTNRTITTPGEETG